MKERSKQYYERGKAHAKRIIRTAMMNRYLIKFAGRIAIFIAVLTVYLTNKAVLVSFMTHKFTFGISEYGIRPLHVLWAGLMIMMIRHLRPGELLSMALRKGEENTYKERSGYSELELLHFVQDMNVKAWKVLLLWLCFNAIFGFLYLLGVIDNADLLMLTMFYFLSDYICILLFCPFMTFMMKNKCCVNCRIYDWGHFMMFTPMLFIRNFFSWSLFFTAVIVLLRWEIIYATHPERFWFGSNKTLQCVNCKDKTCQYKKKITSGFVKTFHLERFAQGVVSEESRHISKVNHRQHVN